MENKAGVAMAQVPKGSRAQVLKGLRVDGAPFTLNGHRMEQHVAHAALGEHAQRRLAEAGNSADAIEALHARRVMG